MWKVGKASRIRFQSLFDNTLWNLSSSAVKDMKIVWRLVLVQCAAVLAVSLFASIWGGRAGLSALLGGLACLIPSVLFALRLWANLRRSSMTNPANPAGFFLGEFVKIMATAVLLFVIVRLFPGVVWPALLGGVVAVLKSYVVLLLIPNFLRK